LNYKKFFYRIHLKR